MSEERRRTGDSTADQSSTDRLAALRERLTHPAVVNRATGRATIAIVAFLIVLFGPEGDPDFLALVVGGALVATAALDFLLARRRGGHRRLAEIATASGAGLVLVVWPDASVMVLGRAVGALLVAYGAVSLVRGGFAGRRSGERSWLVAKGLLAVAGGIVPLVWPVMAARATVLAIGVAWVVAGAIAVTYAAPRRENDLVDPDPAETARVLRLWLRARELPVEDRNRLDEKLFFEGAAYRPRLARFTVLLLLSVFIATLGIITDSTAVVIGAMLIAPLMVPIMATTAALVTGLPGRAGVSALIVAGGTAGAIAFSFIAARFLPVLADLDTNAQIASRVSPTFLDLLIAIAAGAAGAFALAREDVADSLPGVAIAVALVPPLSVVGITLQAGLYGDAIGAFLLYATNLVAIMLAGGFVLVLSGYSPVARLEAEQHRVSVYVATLLAGTLAVSLPLIVSGNQIARSVSHENTVATVVDSWLVDRDDTRVMNIAVNGGEIQVTVVGAGDPPGIDDLVSSLSDKMDSMVTLDLRWIPEHRSIVQVDPSD
ncbi:MAG: DUF389 domain-containing protein [Acidimicrobiia bacterium]|nr:DUF389 domain-containing protein [Acidimicrobiia bacterium]